MVDCNLLRDTNKQLIVYKNRLLLESKSLDYSIEILFANKTLSKTGKSNPQQTVRKIPINAVYGIMYLEVEKYLVVVTKAFVIGQIYHRLIYQVDKVEFVPLAQNTHKSDKPYIDGLTALFDQKQFYYSNDYDLTNSLERFMENGCSMNKRNYSYFYNSPWIEDFYRIAAHYWVTGFISGLISINFCTLAGYTCYLVLLSRRDKRRQGARWICRGSDLDGNTANTVETEQMLFAYKSGNYTIFSFVQTRGSMPFKWAQSPDLKWSPKCYIMGNDKVNCDLCKKHIDDMKKSYDNICLVNLIDKKGSQKYKMLGTQFYKLVNSLGDVNIRFVWFDFHSECKKMKYENLSKLVDMISRELSNYGYYHIEKKTNSSARDIISRNSQKGVVRSNCMDCLDRTNVVQSVFARNILHDMLSKLGIGNKSKTISAFERLPDKLYEDFRVSWTKNADMISMLYSGTPAMKTDFTLFGKRTLKGSVMDLFYGVKRYFLGNFYDSERQDIIDVSVGRLKPKRTKMKKPLINLLYVILFLFALMPFLARHAVDNYWAPPPLILTQTTVDPSGRVLTQEPHKLQTHGAQVNTIVPPVSDLSFLWTKIILTVVLIGVVFKLIQILHKAVLRRPTIYN